MGGATSPAANQGAPPSAGDSAPFPAASSTCAFRPRRTLNTHGGCDVLLESLQSTVRAAKNGPRCGAAGCLIRRLTTSCLILSAGDSEDGQSCGFLRGLGQRRWRLPQPRWQSAYDRRRLRCQAGLYRSGDVLPCGTAFLWLSGTH